MQIYKKYIINKSINILKDVKLVIYLYYINILLIVMGIFRYLGSLIRNDTGNSSKSFALVMSTVMSFIMTLLVGGILLYDVYCNGYIRTDLESLAIFMICVYSGVPASGIPKIFGERSIGRLGRERNVKHHHGGVYGSANDEENEYVDETNEDA